MDTTLMYKQLGILKIKSVFKYRLFAFLIGLLSGALPDFCELLLTRNRNFRIPQVSCEVERRALSYQLIKLFEDVPPQFVDTSNSAKILLRNFKKYILSEQ